MKLRGLLLLTLLSGASILNAQTYLKPGYVIRSPGDTLFGKIDSRGDLLMGKVCRFSNIEEDGINEFLPGDIIAYRFEDGKYFVSKEVNGSEHFLEFLINAQVNIYYLRDLEGDHYYVENEVLGISEIPYREKIIYKNNRRYSYKSRQHVEVLDIYMQEVPGFSSRISKLTKPQHLNLVNLAEDYHYQVCDDACIIYEKKVPFISAELELLAGGVNYHKFQNAADRNYLLRGVLAHIWMPRSNEKLFFRTGVLYSVLELENNMQGVYKIPLQLEYIYPKGFLRPKMAYGVNIYSPIYQSAALMGGINIKLHSSFFLSVNYDIDFMPRKELMLIPERLLSRSLLAGLQIKF